MESEPSQAEFVKQAQHIWSMLDELADSDPEGYSKFINSNLKQGKEAMAPPKPYMCVCTDLYVPRKEKLYVNIVSWHKVPKPKTDQSPIPVTASALEQRIEDTDQHSEISCAFNIDVLQECCKRSVEKDMLINLAFDFVQDQRDLKLSRKYEICQDFNFKGDTRTLRHLFARKPETGRDDVSTNFMENPEALLQHLEISKPEEDLCKSSFEKNFNLETNVKSTGGLIQEVGVDSGCKKPDYEMSTKEAVGSKPRRVVLRILLPDVKSVQECDLNISDVDIALDVPHKYHLELQLPETIDDDESKAKFSSKSSSLTVTMPTKKS